MNPENEPSPAESALREALQAGPSLGESACSERHNRIEKAVRAQTAAHDVGEFMFGNLVAALGKLLLTLWQLATGTIESVKKSTNPDQKKRDDNQS